MRVLLANLKLFYQCPRLWLVYLFYAFLIWGHAKIVQFSDRGVLLFLVMMGLPAGWIVGTVLEDVISKAFSAVLPGHRGTVLKTVLLVGSIVSIIGGWFTALAHGLADVSLGQFVVDLCVGLCFAGSTYLIAVAFTLMAGSNMAMSSLCLLIVSASLVDGLRPNLDHLIFNRPILVIVSGLSMAVVIWLWLWRSDWLRQRGTRPADGFLSPSTDSMEDERRAFTSTRLSGPYPRVDSFFLRLMHREHPGMVKYLWGTAYATFVPLFLLLPWRARIAWMLLLLLPFLMAGYGPALGPAFVLMLLIVAANGLNEGSPLFSAMLIGGGRQERFCVTMVLVGVLAGLSAVILMLPILALNLLAPLIPDVEIGGSAFTFHLIPLWLPMLSMIVFPVLGSVHFWFHGRRASWVVSLPILPVALPLLILHPFSEISLVTMVFVAGLSWLVLALVIHRIAMRGDLVRE